MPITGEDPASFDTMQMTQARVIFSELSTLDITQPTCETTYGIKTDPSGPGVGLRYSMLAMHQPTLMSPSERLRRVITDIGNDYLERALNDLVDIVHEWRHRLPVEQRIMAPQLKSSYVHQQNEMVRGTRSFEEVSRSRSLLVGNALIFCENLTKYINEDTNSLSYSPAASGNSSSIHGAITQSEQSAPETPERGLAIVEGRRIQKSFAKTHFSLQPLDLAIFPGVIIGVVGANGSGKSTLLNVIRGEISPDKNTLLKYPKICAQYNDWNIIRPRIGYVPQELERWRGSVRGNLEYALAVHGVTGAENKEWSDSLIARHDLSPYEELGWEELSSGYRLRFELALARAHRPDLLILDEPMANLDMSSQQKMLHDLRTIARSGMAVLLTTQHLYEIEAVADEVIVLSGGRRISVPQKRENTVLEIWGPVADGFTEEAVRQALADLKPAEIRFHTTTCIMVLPRNVTLPDVAVLVRDKRLPCTYLRDITASVRVALETESEPLPQAKGR
jgi:ABC-2 type transport system ATP-binding protein